MYGGKSLSIGNRESEFKFLLAEGPIAVFSLVGDLTSKDKVAFEQFLEKLRASEKYFFIISLRDVSHIDLAGIQFLARIYSVLKIVKNANFLFCSIEPQLKEKLITQEIISETYIVNNLRVAVVKINS